MRYWRWVKPGGDLAEIIGMGPILGDVEHRGGFVSIVFLLAGCLLILHGVWGWLTGEIKVSHGTGHGSGFRCDNPHRVLDYASTPEEFRSAVLTRLAVGIVAIIIGIAV